MNKEIKQRIEQLNNGKIPKGYKKTDFGVFPSDWETDKTLGDLFDFYGGLSKSRDELGEEGYAYLHYGDLHRGTFNTVSIDHYEQLPKCDISLTGKEKCLMEDGDVAFLDASEDLEGTSRAVLIDNPENKPFIAGLHIIYGKSKNNSLDKWFKQYITSSESVKKQFQRLAVGFKVYGVNRDTIPRIKVAFPSSNKEQSRIAEILMKWDEAIELYDKQIDALTRYKAVCLRKMFPAKDQNVPEWRFRGFSGDWKQRKLGEFCDITTGKLDANAMVEDGKYDFYTSGITKYKINTAAFSGPAITIAGNGATVGYMHIADGLFNAYQRTYVLSNFIADRQYLFYAIGVKLPGKIAQEARTGNIPYIVMNMLTDLEIYVTAKAEQKRIGEYLGKLDNLITFYQRKKEAIINQRKILQQYLLNGIVRV